MVAGARLAVIADKAGRIELIQELSVCSEIANRLC
jgi:hypothetical protein